MTTWPQRPIIYLINTWVWLNELSARYQRPIDLSSVPPDVWDELGSWRFDAVWLMGVWERSPFGRDIACTNEGFLSDFRRALPDFTLDDVPGSPYCVHRYVVDQNLGGPEGLARARAALAPRGMKLILDFVPNHVAPDHPWITEHPEYFVQGTRDAYARAPHEYFEVNGQIIARGRDPYFPPWPDVAQLNAFHPRLRGAVVDTLTNIAAQCDGVRCDMAMLMLNDIFARTWGHFVGAPPANDYWNEVISTVRLTQPDFLFMAEAYWDLEYALQQQGFNYCYDKRLYDRLERENAESVRLHLLADQNYQAKLVRFIENHDEPRAASTFPGMKARTAAVVIATLPGAKLFHDGQFEGRRIKLPVLLGRRPDEPIDTDLQAFYRRLLSAINTPALRDGEWRLCDRGGWPDNPSYLNLVAWCWRAGEEKCMIVVNLSDAQSQARVWVPWDELIDRTWSLHDALSDQVFERDGGEMRHQGLYVDLPPWGVHILKF